MNGQHAVANIRIISYKNIIADIVFFEFLVETRYNEPKGNAGEERAEIRTIGHRGRISHVPTALLRRNPAKTCSHRVDRFPAFL